jgi:hypothetical protein
MGTAGRRASVIFLVLTALLLTACSGDDDESGGTTSSTRDSTTTTSTTAASTATTAASPTTALLDAEAEDRRLWPRPSSDVRFDEPTAVARSFARYYAHFDDPVVGDFRAGDARSGEVDVLPRPGGPTTTVLVRQGSDDGWYVVASLTDDIVVDKPVAGDSLTCPLAVSGSALAFEAQVNVRIDAFLPDGRLVHAGSGYVMGSGSPPAAPFTGEIACRIPEGVEPWGIANFYAPDMASDSDGAAQITALPIHITG